LPFVWAGLADIHDGSLPYVQNASRRETGWNFDHERSLLVDVPETHGVDGRDIRCQHPSLVLEILVQDDVTVPCAKRVQMREVQPLKADGR
jgi:hypothetical protein